MSNQLTLPFFNENDEGYSEGEVRMADDRAALSPIGLSGQKGLQLPEQFLALPESQRAELAHALIRSLRTSSIAMIVDSLRPILHIDPIQRLPLEIASEIFAYLDLPSLVTTTSLSKAWRSVALDPRLWKILFASEGWRADFKRVYEFEEAQREREAETQRERKSRARGADAVSEADWKSPKKRARERSATDGGDNTMMLDLDNGSPARWNEQHGVVEADDDEKMEDVTIDDRSTIAERSSFLTRALRGNSQLDTLHPPIKATLISNEYGYAKMNWQYLFKQKWRLEENWMAGRYTNFQLPHPSHSYEGHGECVYTIQYSGKYLVSGSRDTTLRIWNLETQRLVIPPLRGHKASVLCLQFDPRPHQDVIISGGGDCNIIVWQFSTGRMLRVIERAHNESVLNLKFNTKYLITCSKDKTIKVWSRLGLDTRDPDYPKMGMSSSAKFPAHIIDLRAFAAGQIPYDLPSLPEYAHLMTLYGHTAAVNAIQVLDGKIVSASGDRHVKVWDINNGMCIKTINGHQKGIACVQFDGRRIVTGSSDETVRIFDLTSGAEVACLRGHSELVRTVQARFGDVLGEAQDEEDAARDIDREYLHAKVHGLASPKLSREQWKARNSGSREAKDIFAYGAKLPPGGGGGRWARIVSGSYDETIIIWKRDAKGKWTPVHQLAQYDAVIRAGGTPRYVQQQGPVPASQIAAAGGNIRHTLVPNQVQQRASTAQQGQQPAQPPPAAVQGQPAPVAANGSAATARPNDRIAQRRSLGSMTAHASDSSIATTPAQPASAGAAPPNLQVPSPTAPIRISAPVAAAAQTVPAVVHAAAPAQPAGNHRRQGHGDRGQAQGGNASNAARVYKLQFDNRRIICCSQEPTIVGWDFANGDREIEIASDFFSEDLI